jgi:hypothetical protein
MDYLISLIQEAKIPVLIVSGVISIILTLFLQRLIPYLIKKTGLALKNRFFSHEQILGNYYGYYLHKDTQNSKPVLRESKWEISADYQKEHYIIKIYHEKYNKKSISYKGKMWSQDGHYLLQLDSQEYTETIFERKIHVTKADETPIIGISLAVVTQRKKIRANISILSKKKLSLDEFHKIVKENNVRWEDETYNLRIE